jgi:hypothetical protein
LNRSPWIGLGAAALLLAACGRPADTPSATPKAQATQTTERAGPVRWNAATGGFELAGKPLKSVKLWTFEGSTDGFTPQGSKVTPGPDQGLAIQIVDPTLRSPKGLNVPGGQFPLVLVRITRTAAGEAWDGALYYATAAHGEQIGFLGKPLDNTPPKLNETVTLVYDMGHQTIGAPDWSQSTIDQIRLDIEDKAGGAFVVRQIAITDNPDPASLAPAPAAAPPSPPKP